MGETGTEEPGGNPGLGLNTTHLLFQEEIFQDDSTKEPWCGSTERTGAPTISSCEPSTHKDEPESMFHSVNQILLLLKMIRLSDLHNNQTDV